jgi:hypothetical protein
VGEPGLGLSGRPRVDEEDAVPGKGSTVDARLSPGSLPVLRGRVDILRPSTHNGTSLFD